MIRKLFYQVILTALVIFGFPSLVPFKNSHTPVIPEYPAYFGNRIYIPENNPLTEEGIHLGRFLFYDEALSKNNQLSCATCHQQKYAFTDRKKFSTGVDGSLQKRNTMSLVNLLWVRNPFWDGRANGLEEQSIVPLTDPHEMGQSFALSVQKLSQKKEYLTLFRKAFGSDSITGERICMALAQFERILISSHSLYDEYLQGNYQPTTSEKNGMALFFNPPDPYRKIRGAGCGHCHGGPKTFIELYQNNGLDSIYADPGREKISAQAYDHGRFRIVSLRNIELTAPYMHDGRFGTLEEVVDHYNGQIVQSKYLSPFLQENSNQPGGKRLDLTFSEKNDLVAFLKMLTDTSFINDKKFSNPFLDHP